MKRYIHLGLIVFASMVMVISLSVTVFAAPQVQEISFDTKVVNQLDDVVVTIKTTEPIANAKLYLEGQYGSASNYTQLVTQLYTKVDDYTWQGKACPGYVAGYTFYPSWLEYTDLSTGRTSTIYFNKDSFPDARFTVYKNWQDELTKKVSLGIGEKQEVQITCNGLDSIMWSVNDDNTTTCNVSVTSSNESVAGGYCSMYSFGNSGVELYYTVLAKSEGTAAITISNTKTGQIYGIINVTVSSPVTSNVFACKGQTISFEVPFVSKKSSDRPLYAFSGDANATLISSEETIDQISVDQLAVGDTVQHKCIVTMRINNTGGYFLNFYDRDRNIVRAYAVNIREHSYTVTDETEATCQHKKRITSQCSYCGDVKSEEIGDLANHKWNTFYSTDKNATCNENGSKSIHCAVCNTKDETTITAIPALGHDWDGGSITTEATCTEEGVMTFTCNRCNNTRTESIDAKGHAFSEEFTVDQEPSCTQEGSKSKHCVRCDEVTDVTSIPIIDHSFGEWEEISPSTCEDSGIKQRSCVACGYTESENLEPNGHDFEDDFTVDKEATCTEDGSQSKHCKNCEAVTDSQVIPATGHSYGDWSVTKEATCETAGSREKTCSGCEDVVAEEIPALGHEWNEQPTIDKAPTCTEAGSQSIHCARCEATKDEETIPASGHKWNDTTTVDKQPTITEKGSESIHCSVCDAKKPGTENAIPKLKTPITCAKISGLKARVYTGKALGQAPKVVVNGKTLVKNTDYTLKYQNNTKVGLATVIITGKGAYEGTIKKAFKIVPKATYFTKLTTGKSCFAATWNKQPTQTTGYVLQYALNSKFTSGAKKVVISKNSTVSRKVTKLKAKKRYYMRVCTYKKVGGKYYYSSWSKVKYLTTK